MQAMRDAQPDNRPGQCPVHKDKPGEGRLLHAPADHPPVAKAKIGILLSNLGTPDATDYWSIRRYLSEFLSDKRVIDYPWWKWQPILQLFILTKRPFSKGKDYDLIWNKEKDESPLMTITRDQTTKIAERMQAAIAAQGLHDQIAKVRVLSDSLVDVMGSAHDMANALSLVHLSTDLLSTLEDALPPHRRNDLARAEHFLRTSTERIERMLADIRARHKAAEGLPSAKIESVEVAPLVRAVAGTVAQRFPGVTIETGIEDDVRVEVAGGGETLLRVFENLVLNALQGDGNRAADHVYVGCARDARAGSHRIVVEDDGPGFDVKMVERPITAFSSTKASGTGLGLYTVERLVTASGGKIVLENRREGGARVKLDLPRSLG